MTTQQKVLFGVLALALLDIVIPRPRLWKPAALMTLVLLLSWTLAP
jgi:hypothetical protein